MRYQYKIIEFYTRSEIPKKLDKLSEEGWNLICVVEERHYFRKEK